VTILLNRYRIFKIKQESLLVYAYTWKTHQKRVRLTTSTTFLLSYYFFFQKKIIMVEFYISFSSITLASAASF